MRYHRYAPVAALAHAVDCVWTLEDDGARDETPARHPDARTEPGAARQPAPHPDAHPGPDAEPVLPDGRPELIVHLGDPFEVVDGAGRGERQARVLFAGQLESRLMLRPTGRVAMVGVRFHAWGAAGLLRESQARLAGPPAPLDALHPLLARALAEVRDASAAPDIVAMQVQRALLRALDPARIDARVRAAAVHIERTHGRVAIDRLAGDAGVSGRQLERLFLDGVGLTPKRLARTVRFQRALHVLERADPERAGTVTAATCGYADQSHFIREFRALAGCTPTRHLLRRAELTGFFITPGA